MDVRQPMATRLEAIGKLQENIGLTTLGFDLVEKVWLAVRDLIQREQPHEVLPPGIVVG